MKLADWMGANGVTDAAFAEQIKTGEGGVPCDRSTISRVRRGKTRPSWELAGRIKIVTAGAVPPDEFLPISEAAE